MRGRKIDKSEIEILLNNKFIFVISCHTLMVSILTQRIYGYQESYNFVVEIVIANNNLIQ